MSRTLLEIRDLKTYFYTSRGVVRAVDGIDLDVKKGQVVALVGESGCGKSTVALSVINLVPPAGRIVEGKILYKDQDLLNLDQDTIKAIRGQEISIIFQNPLTYLNPVMTVGDQIAEVISEHRGVKLKECVGEATRMLGLIRIPSPERAYHLYPFELSGGMRQRVLIAIALSCKPSLVIADEPTTALDVTIQRQILQLLKELTRTLEVSFLFITHDLGIVAEMADVVNVMYAGKIVERANVFDLYATPRHPYTQGLISSVVTMYHSRRQISAIRGSVPNMLDPPSGCRFHPRCEKAMEICMQEEPYPMEQGTGSTVSCWLYAESDNVRNTQS